MTAKLVWNHSKKDIIFNLYKLTNIPFEFKERFTLFKNIVFVLFLFINHYNFADCVSCVLIYNSNMLLYFDIIPWHDMVKILFRLAFWLSFRIWWWRTTWPCWRPLHCWWYGLVSVCWDSTVWSSGHILYCKRSRKLDHQLIRLKEKTL